MKLPLSFRLAAAAGLWCSSLGVAQEPARLPVGAPSAAAISADQMLADSVAARLAQNANLRGYQVDIVAVNGVVELTGVVANDMQRAEVLKVVQGVPRVSQIRDGLAMQTGPAIQPVNGPGPLVPPVALQGGMDAGQPAGPPGFMPGMGGGIDPAPIGGPGPGAALHPPSMPPYAWPTYAPYNNYSRVAYPESYPQAAFPFIGPFYPFPKVPLGYRAIKLEWEDGHWFYGRTAVRHDFWSVRYW